MKSTLGWLLLGSLTVIVLAGCGEAVSDGTHLEGTAEDLWGRKIDLAQLDGTTLVQAFSPANCGYCLVDGEFVAANYFETNTRHGGQNLQQCLFNPQRDIYAHIKHNREGDISVL
ncbi:hypothetical protein ACFL6M_04150, partial [Candidatus Eisenbacteria bacterium]